MVARVALKGCRPIFSRGLPYNRKRDNEMIKERQLAAEQRGVLRENSTISQSTTIETPAGRLVLRNFCSPSFVESLRAAHTLSGEIVGEVTLAPADAWWAGLDQVYEGAVQVSSRWRRLGIARQLLAFALHVDVLEEIIILAMGLSWHWDMEGLGLTPYRYRQLIAQLFANYGFSEYLTSEPNIRMDPANIMLARIGSHVDQQRINHFLDRLLSSQTLPGL